jgi:excisionase family DNA binding protein
MSRQRSKPAILPPDRLFATAPEAASILRTDERTLRRALESGQVPGFRVGVTWRIPTEWLRKAARGGDHAEAG